MQQYLPLFPQQISKQWGIIALSGAVSILFGVLALMWPLATIWTLAILWGAFALIDGILALTAAWRMHKQNVRWWPYLLFGVIGIAAGIITALWPAITAIALVYVIAFWAILGGISQVVAAIQMRKEIQGEWFLVLSGVIGILFGMLILFRPFPEGILAIALFVGAFAIIRGVLSLLLAYRVKRMYPS